MQATVHQGLNIRKSLLLVWSLSVACLLAASLPAQAANGRNPSSFKAAHAASAAKAAVKIAQAPAAPAKPAAQR